MSGKTSSKEDCMHPGPKLDSTDPYSIETERENKTHSIHSIFLIYSKDEFHLHVDYL
jgi:hypothetical protein